jgi:hypothetical protein
MADQPIIKIPLDSSEFDEFTDKFMKYQAALEKQDGAWAGTKRGIKTTKSEFDAMGNAFSAVVSKAIDPKFARSFGGFQKTSKDSEKSWEIISKDIARSAKEMETLARMSTSFGGFMKGLGVAGLGVGAVAGIYDMLRSAASGVAQENKSSKSLGLALGKESAFGIYGKPLGLTRDDLENAENAKEDITKRLPYMTAGITDEQFDNEDAADLAWDTAKNKARMYSQWQHQPGGDKFALTQAKANGWEDSPDELRLLARNYDDGTIDSARSEYDKNWQKMGVDQQTADQASAFDVHQSANWKEIETSWNKDILLLTPHLDRWSDAATNLTERFLGSTANAIKDLADAADNPTPPGTPPEAYRPGDNSPEGIGKRLTSVTESAGQWLRTNIPALADAFNDQQAAQDATGFAKDPDKAAHMRALEKANGMPAGILSETEMIESSGGMNNINPKNPNVLGAFQFDGPTAEQYGVDRHNEFSGEVGAARKLHDLYKKYGSWDRAVASYDGFSGLDADIKKYGNAWKDHIGEFQSSGETEQYLRKMKWAGVDLSKGQPASGFNDADAIKASLDQNEQVVTDTPDTIDGFKVVPYHDSEEGGGTLEKYMQRLHDGFGMIGDSLKEGGGSQFAMPPQAKPANDTRQAPISVSLTMIQPAGSNSYISMGGIPT